MWDIKRSKYVIYPILRSIQWSNPTYVDSPEMSIQSGNQQKTNHKRLNTVFQKPMSLNEDRESPRRQPGTLRTIHAGHLEHSNYHRHLKSYTSLAQL